MGSVAKSALSRDNLQGIFFLESIKGGDSLPNHVSLINRACLVPKWEEDGKFGLVATVMLSYDPFVL